MKILIYKFQLAEVKRWFTDYVNTFRFVDQSIQQNIDLKKDHTMRVCREILNIGTHLGLSDDELRLAEMIALLHDVGRFEQISRYQTFMDSKSVDHAELGIKILRHFDVLSQLDESLRELIYSSIHYHSKPSLPDDVAEPCLFYCKLIRDADKLDILSVVTEYYLLKEKGNNGAVVLNLPDTPGVSPEVYDSIMKKSIIDIRYVNNLNDFKLLQACWIFDINFQRTLDCIKERRYLEKIHEALAVSPEIEEIFNIILQYRDSTATKLT